MIEKCAETIIQQLEIAYPEEINIEAVAMTLGARVRIRDLKGCEARIIGKDDSAIISVNVNSSEKRQRFSIGHELGHWQRHRGQDFHCSKEDIGSFDNSSKLKEREADAFSADLLMPWFLFRPIVRNFSHADFGAVFKIAERFKTSLSATAIRLIDSNIFPAIIICHDQSRRLWFKRSKDVPQRWFPQDALSHESSAFSIVYGKKGSDVRPEKVSATAWFDRREAERYEVLEQSIPYGDGRSLTLLEIIEDGMLDDEDGAVEGLRGMDDFRWRA